MTSIQICANPNCREPYNASLVHLGGYCCSDCRREHQRGMANARPQPPVPPATWGRVSVNRKNGVDNRKSSG